MEKGHAQQKTERPPVVCIMGHIDHGKSTLLDYVRHTNIADNEAGGITQRISAYEVIHSGKKITFLDTPGHESFSKIRTRGANAADIAILVVSAEDGVKKQTIEAINCLKNSGTAIIVAINKIDKPGADIEKTKISLAENEIYLEGYGGDVPFVPISAKTGAGISELLDLILLVAEIQELQGTTSLPASGVIIEANMDKQKGISATMLIKDGTIESGMYVVSGQSLAPTRIMENFLGEKITTATFSTPIKIIGFDVLPQVGNTFKCFTNKNDALAEISNNPQEKIIKDICTDELAENTGNINVVIKADVTGSVEGIQHELHKIQSERMRVKIVYFGVGDITENDINKLAGQAGYVLGFNVKTENQAKTAAEKFGIEIKTFDIIYKLTEWLSEIAVSQTPKIDAEEITGKAKVLKFFSAVKDKNVIGCRVEEGEINTGDQVKLVRGENEIGTGKIRELQQAKEKTSNVRSGVEFGCQLESDITPAPGDKILAFKIIQK